MMTDKQLVSLASRSPDVEKRVLAELVLSMREMMRSRPKYGFQNRAVTLSKDESLMDIWMKYFTKETKNGDA